MATEVDTTEGPYVGSEMEGNTTLIDFPVPPAEPGWYGVICLGGAGHTTRHALYFDGRDWRNRPTFPWFRSAKRFDAAEQAEAWLERLPDQRRE